MFDRNILISNIISVQHLYSLVIHYAKTKILVSAMTDDLQRLTNGITSFC